MIRFGLLTDLQYCTANPESNRYYRNSIRKLQYCAEQMNRLDLRFVADLGDKIDRDWESYDQIMPLFGSFRAPVHHLAGNHDFAVDEGMKTDVWRRAGVPMPPYRLFDLDNWRFILLDGNQVSIYAWLPDDDRHRQAESLIQTLHQRGGPNAFDWNGATGDAQLQWLEARLAEATDAGRKIIILCHSPVFPDNMHNLLDTPRILAILRKARGIKAWFNGHNHQGNYGKYGETHFITLKGMVDTRRRPAFCTVELFGKHIAIRGYGREPSRILPI
jgi:predicted phosphodiesterase